MTGTRNNLTVSGLTLLTVVAELRMDQEYERAWHSLTTLRTIRSRSVHALVGLLLIIFSPSPLDTNHSVKISWNLKYLLLREPYRLIYRIETYRSGLIQTNTLSLRYPEPGKGRQ